MNNLFICHSWVGGIRRKTIFNFITIGDWSKVFLFSIKRRHLDKKNERKEIEKGTKTQLSVSLSHMKTDTPFLQRHSQPHSLCYEIESRAYHQPQSKL